MVDDDIGIGGGTAIDEELELMDGSGSTAGAGGKDLRLERGVVGYRGTRRAILGTCQHMI